MSGKIAFSPDEILKLAGLSGEMADFPDERHNLHWIVRENWHIPG